MRVVRLSTLRTGLLKPLPGNIPGTRFCYGLSRTQGHSAAGRTKPMKNSNDTIGNRTRAVPEPTAPPRAPFNLLYRFKHRQLLLTFSKDSVCVESVISYVKLPMVAVFVVLEKQTTFLADRVGILYLYCCCIKFYMTSFFNY